MWGDFALGATVLVIASVYFATDKGLSATEKKWWTSLMGAGLAILVFGPTMFRIMSGLPAIGGIFRQATGEPSVLGMAIHGGVFALASFGLMHISPASSA